MSPSYYAPPESEGEAPIPGGGGSSLSTFCRGWFIADLVFCVLRAGLVLLALIGLAFIDTDDPLFWSMLVELGAAVGIAGAGALGNTLLLFERPGGIAFAQVSIASTVVHIGVTVFQGVAQVRDLEQNEHTQALVVGLTAGWVVAFVVRLVLLGYYVSAIRRAKVYFENVGEASCDFVE